MERLADCLASFGARPVCADDAPMLARLYASTRLDLLGTGAADPAFAAAHVAMHQRLQANDYRARFPNAEYLVLHAHGVAVGRLVLEYTAAGLHLVDIALLSEARGSGTGSAVLRALQHWAAEQRCALSLSVQPGNTGARRWYLALGFVAQEGELQSARLRWQGGFD